MQASPSILIGPVEISGLDGRDMQHACQRREVRTVVVKQFQQDATIAFFIRNGFTLHVSGDNLTHHQEYNAVYGHR